MNDILHSFLEFDGDKKDEKWAAEKVKIIIMNAIQIMSKEDYDRGENILYGIFPEVDLNRVFKGKAMQSYKERLSDSSLYIFENSRNAMIDDRIQADLRCYINSLDPAKEEKRQSDKKLLKNRKGLEALMNEITGNNGMPPVQVKGDDFAGNVDEFEEQGGDDLDEESVEAFFESSWSLMQEVMLQKPINALVRDSQLTRFYDKWINSILISLHCCSQVYVDDTTGGIKTEFLYPYQIHVLNATGSNDYKDAQGFRIPKSTNVRGFLKEFGNHFDMEKDWGLLLSSSKGSTINSGSNGITGFSENGQLLFGSATGRMIDFKDVLDLPIEYEYCEWKSITKLRKQYVVTSRGNITPRLIDKNTPAVDGAAIEEKAYEETYRAYYLRVGAVEPKLIKWGKLYMQNIEGFHDEYSGFSIKVNKRDGAPMSEILRPFWQLMNVSFKMFEMLVNDVKPDGYFFNYTSLMKIAAFLQSAKDVPTDTRSAIDNYLQMVGESPNALSDNPTTDEGDPLGGGNMAVLPKKNGLNAAANELVKIMDWIEIKVQKYTATQGVDPTAPDDGFKLSLENKKRSRQQTAFIDFILLAHLEDITITNLNFVQDISKFKDIPAYKYLESMVGYKCMDYISKMKKSPHRYGTFIDTFNNDLALLEMKQLAMAEYQKGTTPLEQIIMIRSFDSVKDAMVYLAKERRKTDKKRQKEQMGLLKQQDDNAEKAFLREEKLQNIIGQWKDKAATGNSLGFVNAAQINAKAAIAKVQILQEGQNKRVADEATNEIDKLAQEYNLQQQQAPI